MSDSFALISDLRGKLATANEEIAQLRAQLAETWQPVEDGIYKIGIFEDIVVEGEILCFQNLTTGKKMETNLPANYRLCRKVAEPTPAGVTST